MAQSSCSSWLAYSDRAAAERVSHKVRRSVQLHRQIPPTGFGRVTVGRLRRPWFHQGSTLARIFNVSTAAPYISLCRHSFLKYASVSVRQHTLTLQVFSVWIAYKIIYQLYVYPRFFSPLRHVPGPPIGSFLVGQFGEIIRGEAGIPQRAWVKQYGSMVRCGGPHRNRAPHCYESRNNT